MCGIYGLYFADRGRHVTDDTLRAMGLAIRHRGPDESGLLTDGAFGFGMQRLSIIDLKTGQQPIGNEDGSVQTVFNGEIYNYRELARHLIERGHVLTTTSDTEVIVHLWEDYGPDCVRHLSGMFALAIWERPTRTLFLARDRLGIKPLYYAETPSGFVFGSELKAILRVPDIERAVSAQAAVSFLRWGYVPDPLAILENVRKLPPAHSVLVREGRVVRSPHAYWDLTPFFAEPHVGAPDTLVAELRGRLVQSVKSHLVSDVPLGAFLSGGVDSTSVVAHMAAEYGASIKTFSIGFDEPSFDERPWARLAAQRFSTEHHELVVRPDSVDRIAHIVSYFDEPFADASAIPTYFVSQLARAHVKVVLSGDGGDEIFAGYDRYVVDHRRRHLDRLHRLGMRPLLAGASRVLPEGTPGKRFLHDAALPRIGRYLSSVTHWSDAALAGLLSTDGAHALTGSDETFAAHIARGRALPFPARLQHLDVATYLPGDILTKVDRMSMAHSIEARVPYLDEVVAALALALPTRLKVRGLAKKRLLRKAVAPLLPHSVVYGKKRGFSIPAAAWLRGPLVPFAREVLSAENVRRQGYFSPETVTRLLEDHVAEREDLSRQLWGLLSFTLWCEQAQRATALAA
jgi:asparagine synthase (glutamine-hydrolysing)